MKRDTTRWLTIGVATVTASLLFAAAAAAEGSVRPDDRAIRPSGTGAIALETTVVRPDDRAIRPSGTGAIALDTAVVRPDDRAIRPSGTSAITLETAVVRPDDRATRPSSPASVTFVESTAGGGFDWADAGIGAATVVGLVLVSVGVFVLVARRRHGPAFS